MRILLLNLVVLSTTLVSCQQMPAIEAGKNAPAFQARDQFGKRRTLSSLMEPNGLVLLFFRSADWRPFCKQQLVQLQEAREELHRHGLGLAAVSYDSEAILRDFSERRRIQYPLLADPDSDIIRSYVLNEEATGITKGMARPGYFYISPAFVVKEKFFETVYTDRDTPNNVLLKLFPQLVEGNGRDVPAPYIKLRLYQSDKVVSHGSRFTVTAEIELPPGTHVYAPGAKGYKPIQLTLDGPAELKLQPVRYPEAKVLYLPAIQESVPVFEGRFRVFQDIVVSADRRFIDSLSVGKILTLQGHLSYQACDSTICYLPQRSAVSWKVEAAALDGERSPKAIQHR